MKTHTKYDLEKFTQGQNFWNINQGKLAKICLGIMHRASSIVGEVKVEQKVKFT